MPKPQYNVKQTDTGSKNYYKPAIQPAGVYNWSSMPQIRYSPMPNLPVPTPKVNPLKNWWNSIVNNARQNPNTLYSNPFGVNAYSAPVATPPVYPAPVFRTKYNSRTYPTSPNTFNTVNNINRGLNSPFGKPSTYPKPNQNAIGQYSDTGGGSTGKEYMSLNTLVNMGLVDPYASDPYEIGGSPYQQGVWTPNPELPVDNGGWGGYGGYGGSSYYSMPNSPRYKGYGGGYGTGGSPRSARYQGNYGGYGGGYGGYAGGQSQRSAWYGALLQWNI